MTQQSMSKQQVMKAWIWGGLWRHPFSQAPKESGYAGQQQDHISTRKKLQGTGKRQAKKAKSKEPKVKEGKRCLNKMGKSEKAK